MSGKRKILLLLVVALGSFALFFWLVLWLRGVATSEQWAKLKANTRPQASHPKPVEAEQWQEQSGAKTFAFPLPAPFSLEEISQLVQSLKEKHKQYDAKLSALEAEREQLTRMKNDIEERKQEVQALMEKVNALLAELDNKKRDKEEKLAAQKVSEEQNMKKLAKLFASMDVDQATERLNQMDAEACARILALMTPRSASKILSQMEPDKVKALTSLMQKAEK